MLNSPLVREILEELVRERTGEGLRVYYQIVNDAGLEQLIRYLASGRSLGELLYKKRRNPYHDIEDFHAYVSHTMADLPVHPLMQSIYSKLDEFMAPYVKGWESRARLAKPDS